MGILMSFCSQKKQNMKMVHFDGEVSQQPFKTLKSDNFNYRYKKIYLVITDYMK